MKHLIRILILALIITLGLNYCRNRKIERYNQQILNSANSQAVSKFNQSEVETNED